MNIKSRIERLEKSTNPNSEFCFCNGELQTVVVVGSVLEKATKKFEQYIADAERPELCDQCRKLIRKRVIIVEGVESEIPKPN